MLDLNLSTALSSCTHNALAGNVKLEVENGCAKRLVDNPTLVSEFDAKTSACLRQMYESARLERASQQACSSYGVGSLQGAPLACRAVRDYSRVTGGAVGVKRVTIELNLPLPATQ
jgi:hypothetical protein